MFNHRHGPSALSTCNFLGVAILILIVVGSHNVSSDFNSEFVKEKICIGTNDRLFSPSDKDHHYRNLRDRYTNCTYVDGNLEITWLDETFDLSFLQHIREVTGYILINQVDVRKVVLPRLQIIRGRTLFKSSSHEHEFALFVMMCKMYNLELPALRDILNGSVAMFNNYNLCHIKTINWNEIITSPKGRYTYVYDRDVFQFPERVCQCDESCEQGCCWGEGPENCQKFSKINCSPQCSQGRCFGPNPRECCHLFCAGGCTGPKQSDCLACKNFYNDGVCTQECPSMQKYNPTTYLWEANPEGKYVYGANCVRKCPQHLLKDNDACVRSCPPRKKEVNGECVPCDDLCPKKCKTTEKTIIHSGNIDSFKDCTVIDGSITILEQSFNGFHDYVNFSFGKRYEKMHPDKLEVFKSLKKITGFLDIQAYHKDFRNLSYFRNLELIEGRMLTSNRLASLYIVKTSLESFELNSLKMIQFGSIIIVENKNLCYTQSINWTRIQKSVEHIKENNLSNNRDESECVKDGFVCDEQCSDERCWGSGPAQCLSCKNVILGNDCFENCIARGIYQTNEHTCKLCHEECDGSCTGPNADQCFKCKNIQDGPFCVSKCPSLKYNDNGQCKHCHENCADGCDGPGYNVGANGCHSCEKAIINENVPERCLFKNEQCPDGYYEWVNLQEQGALKPFAGKIVCRKCHPRCKRCTGYGFHEQVCLECAKYKRGEQCEDKCPVDHFVETGTQLCIPCFPECLGCFGQFANQCYKCRNYKIYTADPISNNTMSFNCTEVCPPEYPHKIFPPNSESYCSITKDLGYQMNSKVQNAILAGVVFVIVVIVVIALVILYLRRQRRKEKENVVKMIMALTDLDDNVPLRPTEVKPNLAKLRIIKEEEMRKGGILGSGAFGNVFKGVWMPEGENVKIPVAIKVLHNDTGMNMSKEFLDEAYIMASVEHPNLLQLLAVCMTSQMMLVTQLMPLGCLLKFVRRYKNKIGSKSLLNWCTQIARGMAYLEERRLVHRDLAARNILVQTSNCVKITDFGLAKLLDVNEEQYKAAGGKVPIKWLAPECIQHRVFTHKSDVWAFGVTIWEVLTYGGRPYESVSAQNVPELLEKGKRLPQPPICTIDVYMIMIKCWMLDAESRPSFKELAEDFAKMSRDPGRYLAIKGDKYMKLPSYIVQDEKEIIRNLASAMDRPEALMNADEYLQPKSRALLLPGISASSIPGSSPNTPSCWPNNRPLAADSPTPQNQQNWDRKLLRYGNNQGNRNASHEAEMSCQLTPYVHSNGHCGHAMAVSAKRYCSDSLKLICKDCDVTDDCFDAKVNSAHQQVQVGDLKLDLPFDEDDYLIPSPQLSDNTTQYMNLIGESKLTESDPMRLNNNFRKYPGYLTIQWKTLLDNPEYIMSQDDGPLTPQTLGISTPDLEKVLTNGIFVFKSQVRQQSSEEKSDHEYYNDFDRLERELEGGLKC